MGIENLEFIIVIISISGFFYLLYFFIKWQKKKLTNHWTILARDLKMNVDIPKSFWSAFLNKFPSINGLLNGMPFSCYMYARSAGNSQSYHCTFSLVLEQTNNKTFRLYKEGFFSKVGKALGGQDVQVGHDDFDNAYLIKSNDETFIKRLLNPRIRQLILRKLPKMRGEFSLDNNVLKYDAMITLNTEKNRSEIFETIKIAEELAKELQKM
ncbi:MAG: hypothetical protein MK207_09585 [Saprospiraceae bacterium]|nr:hypothetical protein [Saprospiraceae bacterium]